jgi:hypothetical protein
MSAEQQQTLIEIAQAIEDRSPIIFMPMVSEFILSISSLIDEYEKTIESLRTELSRFS